MAIAVPAAELSADSAYALLRDSVLPRPIAWVSTIDAEGNTNLAPFSFFTVVSPYPMVLGFSCGPRNENRHADELVRKDTLANVLATKEFVVNICPEKWLEAMVRSSDPLPPGESEFAHIGLAEAVSTLVKPPRVAGSPVAYECRLHDTVTIGHSTFVMGEVLMAHIDESVHLGEQKGLTHRIDLFAVNETRPVGRLGRAHYVKLRELETVIRRDGG
jgi:flavin reductase (DIM6/NTAB) family NADH-FMN oxidoreductase RutF